MRLALSIALAVAGIAAAAPAQAQDIGIQAGDVLVRLRAIMVVPTEKAGPIMPGVPTGSMKVDDGYMPEVDFTYMASDHIGAELIVSTTKHSIRGTRAIEGLGKVASTWALPRR